MYFRKKSSKRLIHSFIRTNFLVFAISAFTLHQVTLHGITSRMPVNTVVVCSLLQSGSGGIYAVLVERQTIIRYPLVSSQFQSDSFFSRPAALWNRLPAGWFSNHITILASSSLMLNIIYPASTNGLYFLRFLTLIQYHSTVSGSWAL